MRLNSVISGALLVMFLALGAMKSLAEKVGG